jgi:hypothetical protein
VFYHIARRQRHYRFLPVFFQDNPVGIQLAEEAPLVNYDPMEVNL